MEESLDLAKREIETGSADYPTEVVGAFPEDFVLPIIITIAVVGAGLFLELLYRIRISRITKVKEN